MVRKIDSQSINGSSILLPSTKFFMYFVTYFNDFTYNDWLYCLTKNLSDMDNLLIVGTNSTPSVFFDVDKGVLELKGKSLPEDATRFYMTVNNSLNEFIEKKSSTSLLEIRCGFVYINTSSSKALYNILKKATATFKNNVSIVWAYEEDDEDMQEQGQDFSDALGVDFKFKQFAA
jgi:hypothetical protein